MTPLAPISPLMFRSGYQLAVQDDGQRMANILASHLGKDVRAVRSQRKLDFCRAHGIVIDPCIGDIIAGQFRLLFDKHHRDSPAFVLIAGFFHPQQVVSRIRRQTLDILLDEAVAFGIDQAKFEERDALDPLARVFLHVFGKAGQLNQDTVFAFRLDDGLRHAERVHALAQYFHRLIQIAAFVAVASGRDHIRPVHHVGLAFDPAVIRRYQERRAALQIDAELDFSCGLLLQPRQHHFVGIQFLARVHEIRKIPGEIVGLADRFREIGIIGPVRELLLQLLKTLDDVRIFRVLVFADGLVLKHVAQFPAHRRVDLIERPQQYQHHHP